MIFKECFDISWPIRMGMIAYPGDPIYQLQEDLSLDRGDACNLSSFAMGLHTGTHLDAPNHFFNGGASVDRIALERCLGKARVIQIASRVKITAADLKPFFIRPGERILIKNLKNEALLDESDFKLDYVGLDESAASYLVDSGVGLIGIEYLSIETGEGSNSGAVHRLLLAEEILVLEGLDLRMVEPGEYFLAAQPLKFEGGNGSPVRAVLMR